MEDKNYGIAPEKDINNVEYAHDQGLADMGSKNFAAAVEAENAEHNMTVMEAARAYPMACFWAFIMAFTIIMESYDVFLIGNFVGLPAFVDKYGVYDATKGEKVIVYHWQSALQVSGQLGALVGVGLAGLMTSRIGYRWATLFGLMLLNATCFVSYFANSLALFFAGQILEGLSWGIFIANSPAYCSEIVPIQLRAACTQMIQGYWAIGSIIVGAVTFRYQGRLDESAYRIPLALQWMFPTPLFIIIWFAPESPWWLVRKGRLEEAKKSIGRLGRKSRIIDPAETVQMMKRTVDLEVTEGNPSYLELFKGTDLRRTLIVSGVYAAQNLTGNLIANQAVYFFEQAGIDSRGAFALGLTTSALQLVFVMLSWYLTAKVGRRPLYVWGNGFNCVLLFALGIAGSIAAPKPKDQRHAVNLAQAALGLIISVLFVFTAAPVSYTLIGETSSIRLRPMTTGFGRAIYYIVEFPCIFLGSYMLNPTGGNLGGQCGYVWGGTALFVTVMAYFFIPEFKDRSYRELDILFKRRVPARKFKQTVVSIEDQE